MKKLRVAIIGQGRSGRDIHGNYFLTDTKRFEVVAIVDEIHERKLRGMDEFNCFGYSSYKELLPRTDIDLVVNSTFSNMHEEITIELLNNGFNVLVEKPVAGSPEELDKMVKAAQINNCKLAFFQQSRFASYYEKIQSIIKSGVLGRIVQININFNSYARRWDWQCCQDKNGGSLFNTGPHPLDQALHLMDLPDSMPNVFCHMDRANTFGDAEDHVKLILTAPNKPLIDLEISSCDAYPSYTYKIYGTRGGLSGNMTSIKWRYYSDVMAPDIKLTRIPLFNEERLPAYCNEKLSWQNESWEADSDNVFTYAVRRLYDSVYNNIVYDTDLIITAKQIRQQLNVINICHKQNPLSKFEYND